MTVRQGIEVPLPTTPAEEHLAGCAAYCLDAAVLAVARTEAWMFYDQRCWYVISAGARVPNGADLEERLQLVAEEADVEVARIDGWVRSRTCLTDSSGALANKVRETAERRHGVLRLVRELVDLGADLREVA